jgi:glycosyltransferase involved in cell wall biosynthesis
MAGKVDLVDLDYFEAKIKPYIDGKQIEYLGEANHLQKNALMGGAYATLFPITWREPFGLVMIESMAAGTPVIAMRMGSTEEIIVDGETGFLCRNVEECINSLSKIEQLNRDACRQYVENNFSIQQMTDGYEAVYQRIIAEKLGQQNGYLYNALVT